MQENNLFVKLIIKIYIRVICKQNKVIKSMSVCVCFSIFNNQKISFVFILLVRQINLYYLNKKIF